MNTPRVIPGGDGTAAPAAASLAQYVLGAIFTIGFLAVVGGFLFAADRSDFVSVLAILAGALLLTALLPRLSEFSLGLKGVSGKLAQMEHRVDEQQHLLNQLVHYSMSASIFHHLSGIALLHEYRYTDDASSRRELYFLRDHGFIRPKPPLDFLVFEHLHGRNLVEVAEPTEIGWLCVTLRRADIPANMLDARNATNLRVAIC
jgi:hypothetical protein